MGTFIFICVVGLIIWGAIAQESNMTDEERADRRRQRNEYRHKQRLIEMELEAQKKARSGAIKGQVAGTVAKVALAAFLGGNTRHRR